MARCGGGDISWWTLSEFPKRYLRYACPARIPLLTRPPMNAPAIPSLPPFRPSMAIHPQTCLAPHVPPPKHLTTPLPMPLTHQVRSLGVSNFCQSCFKCLDKIPGGLKIVPAVNQVQYHIGGGADPQSLVSYCQGRGIAVEAYSPLGDNTRALIHGNLTAAIGAAHKKTAVQVPGGWGAGGRRWRMGDGDVESESRGVAADAVLGGGAV